MGKEIYNGNANENVMPLKYSELHIHLTNLGEQKRHTYVHVKNIHDIALTLFFC